jgi:hypothetical protein
MSLQSTPTPTAIHTGNFIEERRMKYLDGKTKQIQRKKYQSQDKQFFFN